MPMPPPMPNRRSVAYANASEAITLGWCAQWQYDMIFSENKGFKDGEYDLAVDGEGDEENRAVDSGGDGNGRAVRMPQKKAVDGTGDEDNRAVDSGGDGNGRAVRMPQKKAVDGTSWSY